MNKTLVLFSLLISLFVSTARANTDENTGTITGLVITADGNPAAYVTVQLQGTAKFAFTNENGQFSIIKVAPGEYTLEISLTGYDPVLQVVKVGKDEKVKVNLQLNVSRKQLEEVIVVGSRNSVIARSSDYVSKMPLNKLENPQVYTAITRELLKEQVVFSVDDAMRNAPGLQKMWDATGRSGDGGAFYNARGFILQSKLRNGVAGNVSSRIDAANLETIEVIKGPSATLFGSYLTSYGGLINRVTKKPYSRFGGEISFSAGSYNLSRVAADINTPLDDEKNALLRINAAYHNEGSFQDNGFSRSIAIAPSLSYKVNERLSFNMDAEFYSGENTGLSITFFPWQQNIADYGINRADQLELDYKRSYASDDLSQVSRSINFFGQMDYQLSSTWRSQTNVTITNSYSDGASPYFYLLSNAAVTGNSADIGADYISRNDQFTEDSRDNVFEFQQNFIGDFHVGNFRNRVVAGVDIFHNNSDQYFSGGTWDTINIAAETIPTYRSFNRTNMDQLYQANGVAFTYPLISKLNTYSAYLSDVLNITKKLSVLAAVRVDHFSSKGNYDETTGQYAGGYDQTALSPKFGIVYQPVKDKIALFGNYQNGFTNKNGIDYKEETLKPEQANQLEGGIKLNVFGGKLSSTVSYYYIKVKNILRPYVGDVPTDVINPQIQDGSQMSKGFEAEVAANLLEGFNLFAGFAYNESEYLETGDDNVDGLRPGTAMSPTTANLWLSYHMPAGSFRGLGFGFGGNYASDNKVINTRNQGHFILPAYTVLNASVFYDNSKFRASLKLDNLTNKRYWTGYTTINPQKLRQVIGSITFKF